MKIHEYQGKQLFQKYGVPVPIGIAAMTVDEALAAIPKVQKESGGDVVVIKAQIHAGGRGKGGGVKVAKDTAAAQAAVKAIYGMQLVTHQTGPEGKRSSGCWSSKASRSITSTTSACCSIAAPVASP